MKGPKKWTVGKVYDIMYPSRVNGGDIMCKKLFTAEEIEKLKSNPNVRTVTSRSIQYTDEFKIEALAEYNSGKSARKIFSEHGLPIEILGIVRIRGFIERVSREKEKSEKPKEPQSAEKRIKQLERRITYLEQENDFLKKIQKL